MPHAYFDLAAATARFEADRVGVMRSRLRTLVIVLSVFWVLQLVFGDAKVFAATWAIVVLRVSEAAANVAILISLRRRSATLAELERGFVAWLAVVILGMGVAVYGAKPAFVPMMIGSYFVGLLAFSGFGARWHAMAAAHAWNVVVFLPAGLVLMPSSRLLFVVVVSIFVLPYTLLAVSNALRDRAQLAEIDTRLALTATNERLRATEEARSRLFANLSHDLRTPLAIIRSDAEFVLAGAREPAEAQSLERIKRNAMTLVELTAQLLELARIDEGRLPQELANVDVVALAREVTAQLAPPKGVAFEIFGHDGVARADPRHVRRVLTNLVGNAIREVRRSGREGTVSVHAARGPGVVTVDVVDDGPGIPADRRARLFERFAHFDRAGDTVSGIGLALARELANLDGGSLAYVDDAPKTTFRLTLPAANGPADAFPWSACEPVLPLDALPHRTGDAPRILVVEDWPDMADVLMRLLAPWFEVETASTVADAFETARAVLPSAVLADVMLPDGNAYDLLERLRADPDLALVPVVFVSALAEPAERARGLAAGADDYVAKPFAPQELLARVRAAMERAASRAGALEEQRAELALELHDGVAGDLARAVVLLGDRGEASERSLQGARAAVRDGLAEVRSLLSTTSQTAEWRDLVASMRRSLAESCESAGIALSFRAVAQDEGARIRPLVAHAVRRVVQEATTNAIRHAGAKKLLCSLECTGSDVRVLVEDDGCGFGMEKPMGHGLAGIARRARALGGTATFSRGESGGARVEVVVRLDRGSRAAERREEGDERDAEPGRPTA